MLRGEEQFPNRLYMHRFIYVHILHVRGFGLGGNFAM